MVRPYIYGQTNNMKLCKDCNTGERVNGRSYCQSCYWKRFHQGHKKHNSYRRNYQDQNREFIHRYKQRCGCQKCGEKKYWILDLHHINPGNKDFDFFTGARRNRDILKAEMRKCIVLCKNCHYNFHHLEKTENLKIENYIKND